MTLATTRPARSTGGRYVEGCGETHLARKRLA